MITAVDAESFEEADAATARLVWLRQAALWQQRFIEMNTRPVSKNVTNKCTNPLRYLFLNKRTPIPWLVDYEF